MANLYPTEEVTIEETTESTANEVQFGSSWRFDFTAGDFVLTPTGKVAPSTNDLNAYIEWCQKALNTPRYRHPIYSRDYGNEFEDLIGRGLTKEAIESEIKRMATECLMVDARTASVDNFVFTWDNEIVYFTCEVISVRSEIATISSKVVV